jgi:hypothetical protein
MFIAITFQQEVLQYVNILSYLLRDDYNFIRLLIQRSQIPLFP